VRDRLTGVGLGAARLIAGRIRCQPMRLRLALSGGLAAAAIAATLPTTARAAECPAVTVRGVRILDLTDEHGCDKGADLASRTVRKRGYLQTDAFYCRWGQGGTRPIRRRGRTFYAGFCFNKQTEVEATFLARPPLSVCDGDRSDGDDLRARYIACATARRVYRRSLKVATEEGGKVVRFRFAGHQWTCRAYNPHKRSGNPAWYEWKCRAANDVIVHYRWLFGE
jgi:hypothetical protein